MRKFKMSDFKVESRMNKKYCCGMMEAQITYKCPKHENPFDCHDNLIYYDARIDEYGIIIHDNVIDEYGNIIDEGGHVVEVINFCPWCGSKLPESKEDRWFEELEKLGFTDPFVQDIPEDFKTDDWYRTAK